MPGTLTHEPDCKVSDWKLDAWLRPYAVDNLAGRGFYQVPRVEEVTELRGRDPALVLSQMLAHAADSIRMRVRSKQAES